LAINTEKLGSRCRRCRSTANRLLAVLVFSRCRCPPAKARQALDRAARCDRPRQRKEPSGPSPLRVSERPNAGRGGRQQLCSVESKAKRSARGAAFIDLYFAPRRSGANVHRSSNFASAKLLSSLTPGYRHVSQYQN